MSVPSHRFVPVASLQTFGHDLRRPECVVPVANGVLVPDWRGGVTLVREDGSQHTWLAEHGIGELRPNGVALAPDGAFLLANLGDAGGVVRLDRQGRVTDFVTEVDERPLPPANFVLVDDDGRTWITVSTRHRPRQLAWRSHVADGFVVVVDDRGARIVADGLHYTNEVRIDPAGRWLYVVETFGRWIRRFEIRAGNTLGPAETVVRLGDGCFPDGLAFDQTGSLWITSLVSNRLLRWTGDDLQVVLEDPNHDFIANAERDFAQGNLQAEHLGPIPGTRLQQLTSLAFGGRDGRDVFLGCLHTPHIFRFRADVAGAAAPGPVV